MTVRLADAADAEGLWHLRLEALSSHPEAFAESVEEHRSTSVATFAERLSARGSFVVVAEAEGALMGMAGFFREPRAKRRHKGVVWGVYVRPGVRDRGVARALLEELLRRARMVDGLKQIHLSVTAGQSAARALYAGLGFQTFGVEPDSLRVDGRSVDQEHMHLPLSD